MLLRLCPLARRGDTVSDFASRPFLVIHNSPLFLKAEMHWFSINRIKQFLQRFG